MQIFSAYFLKIMEKKIVINVCKVDIEFEYLSDEMLKLFLDYKSKNSPQYLVKYIVDDNIKIFGSLKQKFEFNGLEICLYNIDSLSSIIIKHNEQIISSINYNGNTALIKIISSIKSYFPFEYIINQTVLTQFILNEKKGLLMHGSSFIYNNKGIILLAPSGGGKSTHASLWSKYEDVIRINDDKNFIIYEDDKLMIYSNPLSGKEDIDTNVSIPLKAIVFINKSTENLCKKVESSKIILKLLKQVSKPQYIEKLDDFEFMINSITTNVSFYELDCDISIEAVEVLKKCIN